MLQDIRDNAQGTIAKVIIVVLIISLSIWGMDAIVGGFSGEPEVATVNGEDITEREFLRVVQMESQRRLGQMDVPDPSLLDENQIRREVLDGLIQERVLTQDAATQGLELSDADIDRLITQMPQFQVNGQFNRDQFVAVVRNSFGMGVGEFRDALRKQVVVNQIRTGISQSGFVAKSGAEQLMALQGQTRDFRTLTMSVDEVSAQVQVTDEDVAEYYEANQALFTRPETVTAEYITLSMAAVADPESVSAEAVNQRYEERAAEMANEERHTAHILIEDGDDAEQTIAEVQQKLADGEDFAELAKTYSADIASAQMGGDVGFVGRGMFDEAYEEAMFALSVDEVSGPVRSSFGTHFIKLLDVRKSDVPSLAEMEELIRSELALEQAGEAYSKARSELADSAYSADNLAGPAQELGLEVREKDGVTREGGMPPFDHAGLVRQLYSEDVLEEGYNTELIDVGDNVSVVARVKAHVPAAQLPLEEVAAEIHAALLQQKTRELLAVRADEVIEALESGSTLAELDSVSGSWESHADQGRNDVSAAPAVISKVFALPRPESGQPVYGRADIADGVVIIALDTVSGNVEDIDTAELIQLSRFMASLQGQQEYAAYQQYLRDVAEVERP
ncbi:SurA N-terminal domain-containing protein [Marinobacter zhejiangensis]|uniref:Periplasmic chaperone PpiD n=1 Tax=Marinobacter zhejiangensis TaxID=488535 RepID=A0A1I4NY50_9GAMM|nr:SurA N-terminal domain-containing protein [Marinobacter zhejiangensis]SFM20316.1 peptidyl-prolyl cis-trans isomerase D [Marinobacter zhejiangensis]